MLDQSWTPPRATYRLQLTRDFTFAQTAARAPFLARLGISHAYLSPILTARPGSTHGYDVTDHAQINPELGGEDGYRALVHALRREGLGIIVDIVPNHMGIGPGNRRWMDLLRWGSSSASSQFFDIDWHPPQPELVDKVLLPFLGGDPNDLVAAGEIRLVFGGDGFTVQYHDHIWPVTPTSVGPILEYAASGTPELLPLARDFASLDALARSTAALGTRAELLAAELAGRRECHPAIEAAVAAWNGSGRHRLMALLDRQCWRLADWHQASDSINYRRFFAINDLIAIRAERSEVFEASHALILDLVGDGLIDGLRIDHIDGLADPKTYLDRLAAAIAARGRHPYILVEKILGADESLPPAWPVAGTTGYDRLGPIDRLFCDPAGAEPIIRHYCRLTGRPSDPTDMVRAAKRGFLETEFTAEMTRLAHALHHLAADAWPVLTIRAAVIATISHLTVYRTYFDGLPIADQDRARIMAAIEAAAIEPPALARFLDEVLTGDMPGESAHAAAVLFQQLSGPAMAKGLEDTVFFQHVPLLALNEVGGEPGATALSIAAFHELNQTKQRLRPDEMIAGSTHDTKRGEDARARLLCLTSVADLWQDQLDAWLTNTIAPRPNDAIYYYQTVIGAWPPGLATDDAAGLAAFTARVRPALLKAAREAKELTSWNEPDTDYEARLDRFVSAAMPIDVARFCETIGFWGALTSLSATLLRLTTPGVPDLYQGSDGWNLSMVDPDNRRPADAAAADRRLAAGRVGLGKLRAHWHDGAVKSFLIRRVLALRRGRPPLLAQGRYQPLAIDGAQADLLIGFAREGEGRAIVLAPRFWPRLWPVEAAAPQWGDTSISLANGAYRNILTGDRLTVDGALPVGDLLGDFPVGLLVAEE
ncbi:MAG: glgY [Rhodospirillales bacterium]|nr:glgY [Rhodospirillales bacterium]